MTRSGFEEWSEAIQPFLEIRAILERKVFSVSEAIKILGITKRQFFYWTVRPRRKKTKAHRWIKLSTLDIFGLAILKELRTRGRKTDIYERLFEWLSYNLHVRPFFLHHLAEGDSIFLIYNEVKNEFSHHYESLKNREHGLPVTGKAEPVVIMPISQLLRDILSNVYIENVSIWFSDDKFGNKNKANFAVFDDEILRLSGIVPDNIDNLMHPDDIKKRGDLAWFEKYYCWRELPLRESSELFSDEDQYETHDDYSKKLKITVIDHPPTVRIRIFRNTKSLKD